MLPTISHINFMLSSLSHDECYPNFNCRYASYLLLQNVHVLNLNYTFLFRNQMYHFCVRVLTHTTDIEAAWPMEIPQKWHKTHVTMEDLQCTSQLPGWKWMMKKNTCRVNVHSCWCRLVVVSSKAKGVGIIHLSSATFYAFKFWGHVTSWLWF